jgi:galactokinase
MSLHSAIPTALAHAFEQHFGGPPTGGARAPGRVNLIGEHTDYNGGFVLPCAIDFQTLVAFGRRDANRDSSGPVRQHVPKEPGVMAPIHPAQIRVHALDLNDSDAFRVDEPIQRHPSKTWANYVRGVVAGLLKTDHKVGGLDLAVSGNVPQGAGLSSSASLELAIGQAFKQAFDLNISPTELALIGQQAEHQFAGCLCGNMDQLISAHGRAQHAVLIDCRSLAIEPVPLPEDLVVLIAHSRVRRGLVDSEYNTRRAQCEAAANHCGVASLRDLSLERLLAERVALDDVIFRRARHIVTENERTLDAAEALRRSDLSRLGPLMAQSHASMRDDFEITHPDVDRLVDITQTALQQSGGEGGARMTGGGFGGCIVSLLRQDQVARVRQAIDQHYRSSEGQAATVWVCRASEGAGAFG